MNVQSGQIANQYRLDVAPINGEAIARHDGTVVASSRAAKVMYETRLPPVVYFPLEDVTVTLLETTDHRTFCPFKGTATYWDVKIGDKVIENGAWTYKKALPESRGVEGYVNPNSG